MDHGLMDATGSSSVRRLDVAILDMSTESETDESTCSVNEANSILERTLKSGRGRVPGSQSRQVTRIIDAKSPEPQQDEECEHVGLARQHSAVHGEKWKLVTQPPSIDPRLLMKFKGSSTSRVKTGEITGPNTAVDFATSVEQSTAHERKAAIPRLPLQELRRNIIPSDGIICNPSLQAERQTTNRSAAGGLHTARSHLSPQVPAPAGASSQRSDPERLPEAIKCHPTRVGSASLVPPPIATSTHSAAEAKLGAQFHNGQGSHQQLQTPRPSNYPAMDWNSGVMANEDTALPVAKKPRLAKAMPNPTQKKTQAPSRSRPERTEEDDIGSTSILSRPKAVGKRSQQPPPAFEDVAQDVFDIAGGNERPAQKPRPSKPSAKRAVNAASKKVKAHVHESKNTTSAKSAPKGKKTLRPVDKGTSLASTRSRREQPKLQKYLEDSDSNMESMDDDRRDAPQKVAEEVPGGKQTSTAEPHLQQPAPSTESAEETSDAALGARDQDRSGKANPRVGQPAIIATVVLQSDEPTALSTTNETLVKASPPRYNHTNTQALSQNPEKARRLQVLHDEQVQAEKMAVDDGYNSPEDIAEDSYPQVAINTENSRASFGSKLGQMVQKTTSSKTKLKDVVAPATPFSTSRSFVDSVNATGVSAKLRSRHSIVRDTEIADAQEYTEAAAKQTTKSVNGTVATPTAQMKTIAGIRLLHDDSITTSRALEAVQPTDDAKDNSLDEIRKSPNKQDSIISRQRQSPGSTPALGIHSTPQHVADAEAEGSMSTEENLMPCATERPEASERIGQGDCTAIDLTQLSDGSVFTDDQEGFASAHNGLQNLDPETITDSRTNQHQNLHSTTPAGAEDRASEHDRRAIPGKFHTASNGKQLKDARNATVAATNISSQGNEVASRSGKVIVPKKATSGKVHVVHFNEYGPQNQGISSPDKQTTKPTASTENVYRSSACKQSDSTAGNSKASVGVVGSHATLPVTANIADDNDEGIIVQYETSTTDNTHCTEVESSSQDLSIAEDSANRSPRHPSEGRSASRVDQNGSPRPRPLKSPTHPRVLEFSEIADVSNESNSIEDSHSDIPSEDEASVSTDSAAQAFDPSFQPTGKANIKRQPDHHTHTCTRATAVTKSSPTSITQMQSKQSVAIVKTKLPSRGSIGLNELVERQFPDAQKDMTTKSFKKPALKTTLSRPIKVSPSMVGDIRDIPTAGAGVCRQPLKEISSNLAKPPVAKYQSPPANDSVVSSPGPIRVSMPQTRLREVTVEVNSLEETPMSLRTRLHASPDQAFPKEHTILENLDRGKLARRLAQDGDRTLVEGEVKHPYNDRRLSETESASSASPSPPSSKHSRQDELLWRQESRASQTGIRDALLEITHTVLFRLESEENAIHLKVNDYESGCRNIFRHFQETNLQLLDRARKALMTNSTTTANKLNGAFEELQVKKATIRGMDSNDQMQRLIRKRKNLLTEGINKLIKVEQQSEAQTDALALQ